MAEVVDDDLELAAAVRRGVSEHRERPTPLAVRYDRASGKVVVSFADGASFAIPARELQDLETASDEDLADVSLLGETGLHWEKLDVDFSIDGLMQGRFGTARFMARRQERSGSR